MPGKGGERASTLNPSEEEIERRRHEITKRKCKDLCSLFAMCHDEHDDPRILCRIGTEAAFRIRDEMFKDLTDLGLMPRHDVAIEHCNAANLWPIALDELRKVKGK